MYLASVEVIALDSNERSHQEVSGQRLSSPREEAAGASLVCVFAYTSYRASIGAYVRLDLICTRPCVHWLPL